MDDDLLDEFFDDYERDSKNLKLFINFLSELDYNGQDINLDNYQVQFKQRLTASQYIKRNGRELF